MNANTEMMLQHLDKSHSTLKAAVEQVPRHLRDRRHRSEEWSVAEILEHLALVEKRVTQRWTNGVETAPVIAGEQLRDISIDTKRVLNRSRKAVAPEAVQPSGKLGWETAFHELEDARKTLCDALVSSDAADLGNTIHPHPSLGEMNLYQWIMFLGAHEERHAAQIREMGGQATPSPNS